METCIIICDGCGESTTYSKYVDPNSPITLDDMLKHVPTCSECRPQ